MKYWIFQYNLSAYEIIPATLKEWNVKNYKSEIKKGDKAIIWITGIKGGVYALADIESDPKPMGISEDHEQWKLDSHLGLRYKKEDKYVDKVIIRITDRPKILISKQKVLSTVGLQEFKAGRPGSYGTNIRSNKQEYDIIYSLINGL